jgi:hypothetical protein
VEVGCAYGISSFYVGEALREHGGTNNQSVFAGDGVAELNVYLPVDGLKIGEKPVRIN